MGWGDDEARETMPERKEVTRARLEKALTNTCVMYWARDIAARVSSRARHPKVRDGHQRTRRRRHHRCNTPSPARHQSRRPVPSSFPSPGRLSPRVGSSRPSPFSTRFQDGGSFAIPIHPTRLRQPKPVWGPIIGISGHVRSGRNVRRPQQSLWLHRKRIRALWSSRRHRQTDVRRPLRDRK